MKKELTSPRLINTNTISLGSISFKPNAGNLLDRKNTASSAEEALATFEEAIDKGIFEDVKANFQFR